MLTSGQLQHIVKHSMAYGYLLSQPFSFYVDAYPLHQNEVFEQTDSNLTYGQHNEAVRVLQQKLNYLSYYTKDIDGTFGLYTEHALKQFQKEQSLKPNGQANQETIVAIIKTERNRYLAPLKTIDRTYTIGETGDGIKSIQRALYYFGYYKDSIDGIFGPKTNEALYYFQVDHDLDVKQEINHQVVTALTEKQEEVKPPSVKTTKNQETTQQTTNDQTIHVAQKKAEQETYQSDQLITTAKQYVGTSYAWGGTSPSGFDCSGYINYVFNELGVSIPRTVSDIWNSAQPIEQLSIGDLVFFETYKKGPSHMGIYLGNHNFIHASESKGVSIASMDIDYWQQRYLGAKRIVVEK